MKKLEGVYEKERGYEKITIYTLRKKNLKGTKFTYNIKVNKEVNKEVNNIKVNKEVNNIKVNKEVNNI